MKYSPLYWTLSGPPPVDYYRSSMFKAHRSKVRAMIMFISKRSGWRVCFYPGIGKVYALMSSEG